MFSRILVIPVVKGARESSLTERLAQQELEFEAKKKARKSVGKILELCKDFENIKDDYLFQEVDELLKEVHLDPRSKMNYGLLLYSTGKVRPIKVKVTHPISKFN